MGAVRWRQRAVGGGKELWASGRGKGEWITADCQSLRGRDILTPAPDEPTWALMGWCFFFFFFDLIFNYRKIC
jgi:hypothetical protein